MALIVNEIFYSIQGESTWSGLPFVFVRLTGCNLRCRYCDTVYAYEEGSPWEIERILDYVKQFHCPRLTLTGGEPLMQAQTPDLVSRLVDQGITVTLETNGSRDIAKVDQRCIKIMDIKGPSSGMQHHTHWENLDLLRMSDQVKMVIADRNDFDFACSVTQKLGKRIPAGHILFSPAHGRLSAPRLADWMIGTRVDARLQIQLHKYLWPDKTRGV